jgi:hypothetical protein
MAGTLTNSQAIIFNNDAGGVSVCIPAGEISIEAVQAKDTPKGSLIVNQSDLPNQHNDFFDAWELADGKVTVSLVKAKEITKKRLRAKREPLLAAQDVAFQRALEAGSDTSAIVSEKNRLRDVTKLADAETTLEGLRAIKV